MWEINKKFIVITKSAKILNASRNIDIKCYNQLHIYYVTQLQYKSDYKLILQDLINILLDKFIKMWN